MAFYRKLNNGWQYRISYKDKDGKYKEKSKSGFRTKTEAKAEAEKLEKQLSKMTYDPDIKLIDYLEDWYGVFKLPNISEVTNRRNLSLIKAAKDLFKTMKLKDLTRTDYQKAINAYAIGRSKNTVRKFHELLSSCFRHAEYDGIIEKTPAFDIEIEGSEGQDEKMKYLDKADADKLRLSLMKGYQPHMTGRAMCLFALETGARVGEVMAILEEDVDFESETVSINKSYDYSVTKSLQPTKTKNSKREIAVGKETIRLLEELTAYNKIRYVRLGLRPENRFVFAGHDLKPISTNGANEALKSACRRAGIKEITFHGLRHTHASILIYEEVPLEYVSQRLGHAKTSTTADIYTHVIQEMRDKGDEQVRHILNFGSISEN